MATTKKTVYTEMKQKAVCCGKIYVTDGKTEISQFKCKNCGQKLVATKTPYVFLVTRE